MIRDAARLRLMADGVSAEASAWRKCASGCTTPSNHELLSERARVLEDAAAVLRELAASSP